MLSELIKSNHLKSELPVLDQVSYEHTLLNAESTEGAYEELSQEELIAMMDMVPLMPADDGWD